MIAGHKRQDGRDDARISKETRRYIRDLDQITQTTNTARELYDQVLHPGRVNPGGGEQAAGKSSADTEFYYLAQGETYAFTPRG